MPRIPRRLIRIVILCAALAASGCASGGPISNTRMAAVAPMLSVERFLQAVNIRDLEAMARIFGTEDGPIIDQTGGGFSCAFRRIGSWIGLSDRCVSWTDIELRMDAIAQILRHDNYRMRSESSVAGRVRPTTRIGVDIDRGGTVTADVPFVVVQTSDGRWLIENVDLTRLTALRELPGATRRFPFVAFAAPFKEK